MSIVLSSSLEDYLESIMELRKRNGVVRITDISQELSVEKSSVNSAVKKLKNLKLVTHERYEDIHLTEQGELAAIEIRKKHETLTLFFSEFLGIPPLEAEKDACRIEHVIADKTFDRLSGFIAFLQENFSGEIENWKKTREDQPD